MQDLPLNTANVFEVLSLLSNFGTFFFCPEQASAKIKRTVYAILVAWFILKYVKELSGNFRQNEPSTDLVQIVKIVSIRKLPVSMIYHFSSSNTSRNKNYRGFSARN